jgi:streptogramin lyase
MKNEKKKAWKSITAILFAMVMIASVFAVVPTATAFVCSKTYTVDADFDEGTLIGVEHETVHDQLQLSEESGTLPFIWVPNSNEGTVSKYDTVTGYELGRYWTGPDGNGNPSRTTVDLEGSVWFGNRNTGTVVKIGLYEKGNWIDKNHDGFVNTSTDLNGDGNVTNNGVDPDEILPWNTDECVLFNVSVGSTTSGPRGLAVDANNDLWVGTYSDPAGNKFYHIDGDTGTIIAADTIDISPYSSYGAVIDENGDIWSSSLSGYVLKINTTTKTITPVNLSIISYGLGIDGNGHLFVASWGQGNITKIDITAPYFSTYSAQYDNYCRGVAVTDDGDVWVVNSMDGNVTRLDNNLNWKATIDIGAGNWGAMSTGVAVDAAGKVWACNYNDGYLKRIDPTIGTGAVDLSKHTPGYDGTGHGMHYSYSDMTGIIVWSVTTKTGTWTVDFDSEVADTPWGTISWNSYEPAGTSVTVRVRSSNDLISWSSWETATNGVPLSSTPDGQYIQIETTLKILSGDVSPILYDLTVECSNQPPNVTDAYPSIDCLWPPNHKFVDITIEGVTDPDSDEVTITITKITSDEPTATIEGAGGAKHAPDASGVGTDTASLRAERSGTGNGRVYEITFVASDGIAETEGSVLVKVPHDQSGDCVSIDSGQNYDATEIN